MTSMAVANSHIMVPRGLYVDTYNLSEHKIINLQDFVKTQENDYIIDVAFSSNEQQVAIVTATSKSLIIFDLPLLEKTKSFELPKTVIRIRFTPDSKKVLVADKNGDVLLYDTQSDEGGKKILGHLSLLLDVLQTPDGKYIISSDRDEKIRVSCYPNTYNINSYCLGHTEFVNHLELLPHDNDYLTSTSGDGTIKCWKYREGKLFYTIDTAQDVKDLTKLDDFAKSMDIEGVEVTKLPIVHYTTASLNQNSSLLAVTLHNSNYVFLYSLKIVNSNITHKLEQKVYVKNVPAGIKFYKSKLYVFNDEDSVVLVYKITYEDDAYKVSEESQIKMFSENVITINSSENTNKFIKALYKRKFDNVQEYLKRKMQRLEKK